MNFALWPLPYERFSYDLCLMNVSLMTFAVWLMLYNLCLCRMTFSLWLPYDFCFMTFALWPLPYDLYLMTFALWLFLYNLCSMTSVLWSFPYDFCFMTFALWPLPYNLCHITFSLPITSALPNDKCNWRFIEKKFGARWGNMIVWLSLIIGRYIFF